ncbi:MAG: hypothetical protein ACI9NN_002020 [Bacteroidia bacterium]|jgi:hypothetical protein
MAIWFLYSYKSERFSRRGEPSECVCIPNGILVEKFLGFLYTVACNDCECRSTTNRRA